MLNSLSANVLGAMGMVAASTSSSVSWTSVSGPIVDLINSFLGPAILIVGALGILYCILLGVKYATAEEPQAHEKAKNHLKNAIIGFILIFVLMLALRLGIGILSTWLEDAAASGGNAISVQ